MLISIALKDLNSPLNLDVDLSEEQLAEILQMALQNPSHLLKLVEKDGTTVFLNPPALVYCKIVTPQEKKVGFGIG